MTKMAHIVGNKVTFVDLTDEQKLKATDYMALGDYTMPDYIKTWRQSLRDIPTNYTTESKYDELLEKENGVLKHSIWTQPTE
jgi:hypothetical protein